MAISQAKVLGSPPLKVTSKAPVVDVVGDFQAVS
jgi:hypothetical protein